jgi:hypothetical protein
MKMQKAKIVKFVGVGLPSSIEDTQWQELATHEVNGVARPKSRTV